MNWFASKDEKKPDAKGEKTIAPANEAFPTIGDDRGLEEHVSGDPGSSGAPAAGTVEELSKRFDEYKEASETREARLLNALTSASAPAIPVAAVAAAADAPKAFEPAELPDAVENPGEYAKVLQANIEGSVQHKMDTQAAEAAQNNTSTGAYDGMWDTFKGKYEDLAKHEELVEIHAGRVAKTLAAQGVDVKTYMVQNRDRFLGDVAKSVGYRLVELGLGPKEDQSEHQPDPMKTDQRTGGLPGVGTATGSGKTDDNVPAVGGFISQIQETQKKMGIV